MHMTHKCLKTIAGSNITWVGSTCGLWKRDHPWTGRIQNELQKAGERQPCKTYRASLV